MWSPYTGIQINDNPETVQSGAKALVEERKGRRAGLETSVCEGDYGVAAGWSVCFDQVPMGSLVESRMLGSERHKWCGSRSRAQ